MTKLLANIIFFFLVLGSSKSYIENVYRVLETSNSHAKDTVIEGIHEFVVLSQGDI